MHIVYESGLKQARKTKPEEEAIAATIFRLHDMVRNVTQNEANVQLIVPPGASTYFFEPSSRDLQQLQGVKIIFYHRKKLGDVVCPRHSQHSNHSGGSRSSSCRSEGGALILINGYILAMIPRKKCPISLGIADTVRINWDLFLEASSSVF